MLIQHADPMADKGWSFGPWNAEIDISVGYANVGVDILHHHRRMTEIYCVARGTAEMRVDDEMIMLQGGDVIVVEPGETHTFVSSSSDYFHYVIQTPGLQGHEAKDDKVTV